MSGQPKTNVRLDHHDPASSGEYEDKAQGRDKLKKDAKRLARYQELLYIQNRYSVLLEAPTAWSGRVSRRTLQSLTITSAPWLISTR